MSDDLHILHLADTHIGAALPARPRVGRRYRGNDLVEKYNEAVTAGLKEAAKILIHAGDVFDTPTPHAFAVHAACSPLLAAAAAGTRVFVVPGNHERSALPASLMLSHKNIHIFRQPETVVLREAGMRVAIIGIPCIRRGARDQFPAQLAGTGWAQAKADLNILICHQAFVGAVCGIQNYRFPLHEDNISPADIPAGIHYVAAGHIHRHQAIPLPSGDGEIVYAGSLERVSFVEREESKGIVRIAATGAGLQWRFVEHSVRPMAVVPIDITGFDKGRICSAVDDALLSLKPNAVAQLRISGQITRGMIAGLGAAERVRRLRPQAHVELNFRAVEYVPQRVVVPNATATAVGGNGKGFAGVRGDGRAQRLTIWEALPGGAARVVRIDVDALDRVPTGRGNYALFARDGRLLYIGKAAQARARVRTHLNPKSPKNAFGAWTRDATHVEIRSAASEFEAAMIEFELIRRFRPPFNRQFREARSPYFLVVGGREFGQLDVAREPQADVIAFGPFGSRFNAEMVRDLVNAFWGCAGCPRPPRGSRRRRYAAKSVSNLPLLAADTTARLCDKYFGGICVGPCAGKIASREYADRVAARNKFLAGEDDTALQAAEAEFAAVASEESAAALWEAEAPAEQLSKRIDSSATGQNPSQEAADAVKPQAPATGSSDVIDAEMRAKHEETLRTLRHIFDRAARLRGARRWGGVAFGQPRDENRFFYCLPRADHFAFMEGNPGRPQLPVTADSGSEPTVYARTMIDGVVMLARMLETDASIVQTNASELGMEPSDSLLALPDAISMYGAIAPAALGNVAAAPMDTKQLSLF